MFFFIFIALISFFIGYFFGKSDPVKTVKKKREKKSDITLRKEYENFLNYDGEEQT